MDATSPVYVIYVRPDGKGRSLVERVPVQTNRITGDYELSSPLPSPVTSVEIQHIEHCLRTREDLRVLQSIFLDIHPSLPLFYEWFSLNLWMREGDDLGLLEEVLQMDDPPGIEQLRAMALRRRRRKSG